MKRTQREAAAIALIVIVACTGDRVREHPTSSVGATGGRGGASHLAAGSASENTRSAGGEGTSGVSGAARGGTSARAGSSGTRGASNAGMPAEPTSGNTGVSGAAGVGTTTDMAAGTGMTGAAGVGATTDMAAGTGMTGAAGTPGTSSAAGPKNGDPNKPIVAIGGLPCGGSRSGTNEIGGREVTVDYPCDKHEGAHVTVILNLHGTLIGGAPYLYQHAYFSAHRFVDSHNLIVLTPRSVSRASLGAQWGNTDDGEDVPHLLAVIEWAYSAFSKFQIRGLWVGGHSWGARFISGTMHPVGYPFACHPMLEDKMKGVIGMSHLRTPIACANRLSLISTRGEEEDLPLPDHTVVAMEHGCTTPMKGPEKIGNNDYRYFERCEKGWVYEDYEMLGKGHTRPPPFSWTAPMRQDASGKHVEETQAP